jgi:hypothetical protein
MQQYNSSKYLPDPEHPELQCPVDDYPAPTAADLELHILTYHDTEELVPYLIRLQDYNWEMEKAIRKLTGKQSYEIINGEAELQQQ